MWMTADMVWGVGCGVVWVMDTCLPACLTSGPARYSYRSSRILFYAVSCRLSIAHSSTFALSLPPLFS